MVSFVNLFQCNNVKWLVDPDAISARSSYKFIQNQGDKIAYFTFYNFQIFSEENSQSTQVTVEIWVSKEKRRFAFVKQQLLYVEIIMILILS